MSRDRVQRLVAALPVLASLCALLALLTPASATVRLPADTQIRWEAHTHELGWDTPPTTVSPWSVSASVRSTSLVRAAGVDAKEPGAVDPQLRTPGFTVLQWSAWRTTCVRDVCVDRHKRAMLRLPEHVGARVLVDGLDVWLPVTTVHTRVTDGRVLRVVVGQERLRLQVVPSQTWHSHVITSEDASGRLLEQHVRSVDVTVRTAHDAVGPVVAAAAYIHTWLRVSQTPAST